MLSQIESWDVDYPDEPTRPFEELGVHLVNP
jgi:hypothetical protein